MGNMKNTYWNENGMYQSFVDTLEQRIPAIGYTSNVYVNIFIAMSHLYYDAYNNGGCNIEDCYMRDYRQHIMPHLGDMVDPQAFIYGNSAKMEAMMNAAIIYIKDKNLEFPVYSCWANHNDRAISFKDPVADGDGKEAWFKVSFGSLEDLWVWAKGYQDVSDNFVNRFYKVSDGSMDFYVNAATGEKKFRLDPDDVLVEMKRDDLYRNGNGEPEALSSVLDRCEKESKSEGFVSARDCSARGIAGEER